MLAFRPAIGERKCDSEKETMTEVGSFISLGPGDSCEFFHDPLIQSRWGVIEFILEFYLRAVVAKNILKTNERLTVPVSRTKFAIG
uniref:Uncharacterized protein n=1 Tax=Lactuca sativa TaxID=4236 RepID=A0A9R1WCD0_LACSA|nr:hypothetical protein LSAT_V11C200058320 [Lactuca sativa]